jgi:hypothetical protein
MVCANECLAHGLLSKLGGCFRSRGERGDLFADPFLAWEHARQSQASRGSDNCPLELSRRLLPMNDLAPDWERATR